MNESSAQFAQKIASNIPMEPKIEIKQTTVVKKTQRKRTLNYAKQSAKVPSKWLQKIM
jgi:hypothetical protein